MTDERKQAEEILIDHDLTYRAEKRLWIHDSVLEIGGVGRIIAAMEEFASLKVAEATKEMYPKEFCEWLMLNEWTKTSYGRYQRRATYEMRDTFDELFEYWKQNIQGK